MDPKTDATARVSRRDLVRLGGATVAVGMVAFSVVGCGDNGNSGSDGAAPEADSTGAGSVDPGGDTGTVVTELSAVPVGSAVIAKAGDESIVVAQPEAGQVKGFSARCTHQGCIVTVKDTTTLECPCHLSTFSALTGAVMHGPATTDLPSVNLVVQGVNVVTA